LLSVALPTITTPRGGGAIRSIAETFRANPVTGTGSLAVPLPLSPSRGGSGPKLTLSYDSGQGQSPFGMGWGVDLPSIARRTDRGLPQYRDADESDEFLLSGAEVLVPALVQSGSSWQPEELDDGPYHVQRYRPRIDGAFTRIEKRTHRLTGEVHWRTITRDNTTSIFGKSPSARLADPKQPLKVFRWLLEATFDDRGNVTWFEYQAEDTANVPHSRVEEKTRLADPQSFANRYVKRIHYGNRAPLATTDPTADDLGALTWLFEVVFDYGEHDANVPTPDVAQAWPCRQDPFSSFKATFDVRTYRLCRRVLMFHRFDELGPAPVLVRSLNLAYEESPVTTYLRSITQTGWQRSATGYTIATAPRLDFDYTRAELRTEVQSLDRESVVSLPSGVDGARYRFVDLDGEGIPGVLSQQGGALFYARNDGEGHFERTQVLGTKPNVTSLGVSGQMLTSLGADGRMDLVLLGAPPRGYFEREGDSWSEFRGFSNVPSFHPADPNVRFLDVDGDGLADVIVAEDEVFVWSRSLGKDGFDRPQVVRKPSDEDVGPNFVFADATESIFLADMTGDGLVDLVRVRNGEISYWPNLGYGRFGGKITMGAAPCFDRPDAFDPRRLRFGDVDGSGTSDIAYVRPDGVALYLNQAGNRWSDPLLVPGIPAGRDIAIELVDLLGTGTACLVWSSPDPGDGGRPVRYVDLLASTKPHLLDRVTNNLGLETRIAYAPSTRFYLEDRAAGTPWVTRLPFPVQVIARVETADAVQKTRFVTTYRYKHGFFDGFEREFRGFGRVEQLDAESYSDAHGQGLLPPGLNEQDGEFFLPPVRTVTWLDTGAWREARDLYAQYRTEWYALDPAAPALGDPILPDGLTALEEREAARARKGMILRREVYADDGTPAAVHPYAVEEHRYEVRRLQPMQEQRHPVFFSHERELVGRHYERNPADPRVEHTFTLDVDAYGNVLRSAQVAYPRRVPAEPEQGVLLATCADASFFNETGAFYRLGVPIEARSYELKGLTAPASSFFALADVDAAMTSAATIAYDVAPTAGVLQKRVLADKRTLYLSDDLTTALPLGTAHSRALVYEAYAKALPASLATSVFGGKFPTPAALAAALGEGGYVSLPGEGDWWRPSGRPSYDAARFYQATAMTDPFGNTARIVLDPYTLLPVEAHTSDDPTFDNVVLATNDYRVLHPALVTDPNGNQTALAFDALGMVVATAVMGKPGGGEGDTLADPTTRLEYDLLAWQNGLGPAYARALAREQHGAANTRWQETYSYSDGSGQEVLKKVKAEPDPAAPGVDRWRGTGRTVFDNKGNPVKKYEPYFSPTSAYEDEPSILTQGVTLILRYDPLSRLVRTDFPNGIFETVEFDPWSEVHADANDNVLESAWYAARLPTASQPMSVAEQRAATLAAKHAHTPAVKSVDPFGRRFLVVEDNGAAGTYPTRTRLDIEGNALGITDARGNQAMTQVFALKGQAVHQVSIDAGERWMLTDVLGKSLLAWDSLGRAMRVVHDRLRRPVELRVEPGTGAEMVAERSVYGEGQPNDTQQNLRGRIYQQYDGAGLVTNDGFDFKGNPLSVTRQLAEDYATAQLDWSATPPPALDPDPGASFNTTAAYDALNRVTQQTTHDGSAIQPTYNQGGFLQGVTANVRGAVSATVFVQQIDYNAKGQRESALHGNGALCAYTYDPMTFRLAELKTTRNAGAVLLQDLGYTYDPVGNVVAITDGAQQVLFRNGEQVSPNAAYEYDALYRLTAATGREHAGQNADIQQDQNGFPLVSAPNPNDPQALRNYAESYLYDPVGNILQMKHDVPSEPPSSGASWTRKYEIDVGSNKLLSTSLPGDASAPYSAKYTHDALGNMTSMPHLASVAWDFKNQMRAADLGSGATEYYVYDAAGQRVRKVWEHDGLVDEWIYVGGYEVYQRRQSGSGSVIVERQTLHVMDGPTRVAMVETKTVDTSARPFTPAARLRYQMGNHLGSVALELDEAGAVISYEEYHPYGMSAYRAVASGVEVSAKRYRYTGKERDEETGLYYHGARYYASWLARWTACDPAGLTDGLNLYRFLSTSNPLRHVDSTGADTENYPGAGLVGFTLGPLAALAGIVLGPAAITPKLELTSGLPRFFYIDDTTWAGHFVIEDNLTLPIRGVNALRVQDSHQQELRAVIDGVQLDLSKTGTGAPDDPLRLIEPYGPANQSDCGVATQHGLQSSGYQLKVDPKNVTVGKLFGRGEVKATPDELTLLRQDQGQALLDVVDKSLFEGKPVAVGLDVDPNEGSSGVSPDGITDHWAYIIARSYDPEGRIFYLLADNASTGHEEHGEGYKGYRQLQKLYVDHGTFTLVKPPAGDASGAVDATYVHQKYTVVNVHEVVPKKTK
jgi:RHS repeat-associated protein